ncbi:MAG: alpha/beta hydrolase [Eubacterium sp.]|nr:alpha/beta hydrolase [Eubacterium sp.]
MFTEIDGLNINYIDRGEGDCVLLLHGWGSNITLFNGIVEQLCPHFRVIAPDMPGFGDSDEPADAWRVDDYVDFTESFCDKLHIKNPIILGHSFGGRVIIKLVTRENSPVKADKLILTDSAGIMPKRSAKSKLSTKMYKAGRTIMSTAPMKALFPDAVENMRNKRGSADYLAASPIMRQTLVNTVNEDLTDLLPKIKQSTLLIWGDRDDATPLSDGQTMEKLIPDSGLAVINGAGHYSFIDNPYTFSRILASFLNI